MFLLSIASKKCPLVGSPSWLLRGPKGNCGGNGFFSTGWAAKKPSYWESPLSLRLHGIALQCCFVYVLLGVQCILQGFLVLSVSTFIRLYALRRVLFSLEGISFVSMVCSFRSCMVFKKPWNRGLCSGQKQQNYVSLLEGLSRNTLTFVYVWIKVANYFKLKPCSSFLLLEDTNIVYIISYNK